MEPKLGSLRHSIEEKRERERLLSSAESYPYASFPINSEEDQDEAKHASCFSTCRKRVAKSWSELKEFVAKAVQMGKSDPRKVVYAGKVGLALMLMSLMIYLRVPFDNVNQYSVWAILTVVVVFEFSIGATFSKGLNRGIGTLSAGGLALGMAVLSTLAGEFEELVIIISIFIMGSWTTYLKLSPVMKPYEYGFRVFLLTYCFVMVSGYRTRDFIDKAVTRFVLIALGASVGLAVNTFIYPIWAGEDLHNLVSNNFMKLADSLEGCVCGYLNCVEYKRIPSKILTYEASDDPLYSGYRSAIESKAEEDNLVGFAVWEPPHGPYKMLKYPWQSYTKVSGALRHCSFMVMALHGCILSEIQAQAVKRMAFHSELRRVGQAGAKVLRHLGSKIKAMEKLGSEDLLREVHEAVKELQRKIDRKSYLLVNSELWEIGGSQSKGLELSDLKAMDEDDGRNDQVRGHDEANRDTAVNSVLDIGSLRYSETSSHQYQEVQDSHDVPDLSTRQASGHPQQVKELKHQMSLPVTMTRFHAVDPLQSAGRNYNEGESNTYENARALSLATFASLLIEFVARLQNVLDSFEELSDKAKFKEAPNGLVVQDEVGCWARCERCFPLRGRKNSDD